VTRAEHRGTTAQSRHGSTKENRGIEAFSIPRFSRVRGRNSTFLPSNFQGLRRPGCRSRSRS